MKNDIEKALKVPLSFPLHYSRGSAVPECNSGRCEEIAGTAPRKEETMGLTWKRPGRLECPHSPGAGPGRCMIKAPKPFLWPRLALTIVSGAQHKEIDDAGTRRQTTALTPTPGYSGNRAPPTAGRCVRHRSPAPSSLVAGSNLSSAHPAGRPVPSCSARGDGTPLTSF